MGRKTAANRMSSIPPPYSVTSHTPHTGSTLYIGLMSGTSTDGVDAVLADLHDPHHPVVLSHIALPMPHGLRQEFLALNAPGPDELHRAALAGNALARLYGEAVQALLADAQVQACAVNAIGAHGQTVRHDPDAGYTVQLNAPALLAEITDIDVMADFRTRDVAAGGQGAPLACALHAAVLSCAAPRAVLNLGGIANVTILRPGQAPQGFDTGPANMLLDAWIHDRCGHAYDADGQWAASGTANPALLQHLLDSEPWFTQAPPKSTGRDRFHLDWLYHRLRCANFAELRDEDIQATLQSLTVYSIARALHTWAPEVQDVVACGGGVRNPRLMAELAAHIPVPLIPSGQLGLPELQVEALAFAWLAWAHRARIPAPLARVTGARHTSVLGCCYPA